MIISAAAVALRCCSARSSFWSCRAAACGGVRRPATVFLALIAVVYGGSIRVAEPAEAPAARTMAGSGQGQGPRPPSMREGEAIYVWLQFLAPTEPRAYTLPWDMKMAQQLQNAMRKARPTARTSTCPSPSMPVSTIASRSSTPRRNRPCRTRTMAAAIRWSSSHPRSRATERRRRAIGRPAGNSRIPAGR